MGLFDRIKKIFKKKDDASSVIESSGASITISDEISPSSESSQQIMTVPQSQDMYKDSFKLGLAAGYTGRSIKEIETSLTRIETLMATKDWVHNQLNEFSEKMSLILKSQEENDQKRFDALRNQLILPHKEFTPNQSTLPPTPKMQGILQVVKEYKEISYKDLASIMGITVSSLRGLISNTLARTDKLERFKIEGKGWLRIKEN